MGCDSGTLEAWIRLKNVFFVDSQALVEGCLEERVPHISSEITSSFSSSFHELKVPKTT